MQIEYTDIFFMGKGALLIRWTEGQPLHVIRQVHTLFHFLKSQDNPAILDIVPAYDSIGVFFRPEIMRCQELAAWVQEQAGRCFIQATPINTTLWEIPVQYASAAEYDMKEVMNITGLSHSELIEAHCLPTYLVAFIGFLPGFPYLFGLPDQLVVPRKPIHDRMIKGGSVAIGGNQTGIYPSDSPGGWFVIGRTEFSLFQPEKEPYCVLIPGDEVRFVPC